VVLLVDLHQQMLEVLLVIQHQETEVDLVHQREMQVDKDGDNLQTLIMVEVVEVQVVPVVMHQVQPEELVVHQHLPVLQVLL
jgi:hypothetical protein